MSKLFCCFLLSKSEREKEKFNLRKKIFTQRLKRFFTLSVFLGPGLSLGNSEHGNYKALVRGLVKVVLVTSSKICI